MEFDLEELRRNSRIHMDADGVFYHEGERVSNERIQRTFRRGVRVTSSGEVTLHVGPQWCYIDCEDCPFFVVGVRALGGGDPPEGIELRLSDESCERLRPDSLELVGERLYARVKSERVPARFLRSAYHQISQYLVERGGASQRYALRLVGGDTQIATAATPPALS